MGFVEHCCRHRFELTVQGLDRATGKLRPYSLRYGGSIGGNAMHLSPEVLTATRHAGSLVEGSPAIVVDYDKQPVFDTALCVYRLMTKNKEALPNYPLHYTDVSTAWSA